ncbi:MAG TPA: glucose-6-phosphate dehydrogenase assembly protein OpcA [Ktedonobacteraceae bacterium]|jgi:glucose-6-phosphate dehydrogenase-like protein OpcA|nr:glucose-6-phosphate dehydrogenase assembly protein OpcA [Ktedonobacteraceae bacterium]
MAMANTDNAGPRLPWAGKRVSMERAEEELSFLWRLAADNVRTSQNINVRTSVLNFVICASDIESAQRASVLIRDLSSTHIARVILLILDEDSGTPASVSTWVTLRSFPIISDLMRHHFEQITALVTGSAVRSAAHIIQPLLKPELPAYIWWLNDPPGDETLFRSLTHLSRRVIVDSNSFLKPEESISTLASLLEALPDIAFSDLNWGRITAWRQLVAQFFDVAEYRPYLAGVDSIEIEHAVAPFAVPTRTEEGDVSPNPIRALLLAGWLKTSLGWQYSASDAHAEHDPATGTHYWQLTRARATTGPLSARPAGSGKTGKLSMPASGSISIRPRVYSDMRPGALCLVRLTSMVDNKRATFTIDREDDPDHVLTSVELAQGMRPQRTVSLAATHDASELVHDELEIMGHDYLYEQTLQEVSTLLL